MVRDRTGAIARRTTRRVERVKKATAAEAYGLKQKVTHLRPEGSEIPNDPDLVARVESAVFRDPDIPKGNININAVHEDTIVVRGEVESRAQRRAIERAIKHVHGVRRVESLLHLPGEPAPNKEAAIEASHQAMPPPPNTDYAITHHG
jgi:osmotically-inducible protein OsmY